MKYLSGSELVQHYQLRERFKKKKLKKKLTNVSFMYVCVAGNGEMLVFFSLLVIGHN